MDHTQAFGAWVVVVVVLAYMFVVLEVVHNCWLLALEVAHSCLWVLKQYRFALVEEGVVYYTHSF